jgi:multidrug efflux pump subunit AcrA (membrane-fusion protein)
MTKRQRIVAVIGIVSTLAFAVVLAGVFSGMKKKMDPPKSTPIIRKVESAMVSYQDILSHVNGTGRVLSQYSVDLTSEVQGKLLQGDIPLKKGASFHKGQLLAKVYDTDAAYTMKSRKSSFLNTLANILPDLKIDYNDSYQKWVDFFESIDIARDLPELPEITSNQEKIFLASKGILSDYYSIKSSEEVLKKYSLTAPFSGAIQDVYFEVGSVANPGSKIATIIKTGELEIEVPLQVSDAHWVRKGQKAILKSEGGKEIGSGIVNREASYVDPNSQSINVYVAVLPGTEQLYAGQYLRVEFPGMVITEAMEIPRNATFNNNMVFVVDSGYLAKREVTILKTNEKSVIFTGLIEGTELVVQPLANANANMPVQTQFSNVHKVVADTIVTENIPDEQEADKR